MLGFISQMLGFMIVGVIGVIVNGLVYQTLMKTRIGRLRVFSIIQVEKLQSFFGDITLAWCIGILVAFISNFLLNKYLVFQDYSW